MELPLSSRSRDAAFRFTLALGLSLLSLGLTACATPEALMRQRFALMCGLCLYPVVRRGNWESAWLPAGIAAMLLLGAGIVFSPEIRGARNWLSVFGLSFQPSEAVKVLLIISGAGFLAKGRLCLFALINAVSAAVCALLGDLGGAAIMLFAAAVMAQTAGASRLCAGIIAASCAGCLSAYLSLPYVRSRFALWGKALSDMTNQQAHALTAAARGGALGCGLENSRLREVFAADTDLALALLWEGRGLVFALAAAAALFLLVLPGKDCAASLCAVGACASLCVQGILHIAGCSDLLPFTGVTFPFLSRGGTSLCACWAMLGLIDGQRA